MWPAWDGGRWGLWTGLSGGCISPVPLPTQEVEKVDAAREEDPRDPQDPGQVGPQLGGWTGSRELCAERHTSQVAGVPSPSLSPQPPSSSAPPWSVLADSFPQASWEPSGKDVNLQQKVVLGLESPAAVGALSKVREMLVLVSQRARQAAVQFLVPSVGCSTASVVPPALSGPP